MSGRSKKSTNWNEIVKATMSKTFAQEIARKDKDYSRYAGAHVEDAYKMARAHFLLRSGLVTGDLALIMKVQLVYLDLKRKAYFSSIGSDIFTKLGFIIGDTTKAAKWK